MDQSPFLYFLVGWVSERLLFLLAVSSHPTANTQMKRSEERRGRFCIEPLERLIRTSWVKHEKERDRGREGVTEGTSAGSFKCAGISMGSTLCPFWSMHTYEEVLSSMRRAVWGNLCDYRWVSGRQWLKHWADLLTSIFTQTLPGKCRW